jgi:hypothetical protein
MTLFLNGQGNSVETSGNIDCGAQVFCQRLGVNSNLTVRGGSNSSGLFTSLPSTVDGNNVLAGNTCIVGSSSVRCVVGGTVGDVPSGDSSRLFVRGAMTASNGIRANTNMPFVSAIGVFDHLVGSSSSQAKVQTVTLPWTLPNNNYRVSITYFSGTDSDLFIGKVRDLTTTNFTLVTTRVDAASGWSDTNVFANMLLMGV